MWSPDGTRIAFYQDGELWVMDPAGGNRVNLTNTPSTEDNPAWSPDGAKIAFWSNYNLAVMNVDGSGQQVLTSDVSFGGVDWQPLASTSTAPPQTATPPSPTASPLPIPLPRTGGTPTGDPPPELVAGTIAAALLMAMAAAFALTYARQ